MGSEMCIRDRAVLNRICVALDVNIGDVMEFTNDERDGGYNG